MSQPMTPAAVHKQYDEAMTAFRRQIADPVARVAFGREADGFSASLTLPSTAAKSSAIRVKVSTNRRLWLRPPSRSAWTMRRKKLGSAKPGNCPPPHRLGSRQNRPPRG